MARGVPENEDFWRAIQEFAERHGATLSPLNIEELPEEEQRHETTDKHGQRIWISPNLARVLESFAKKIAEGSYLPKKRR